MICFQAVPAFDGYTLMPLDLACILYPVFCGPQLPLLVALTTFLVHNKFLVIVMD